MADGDAGALSDPRASGLPVVPSPLRWSGTAVRSNRRTVSPKGECAHLVEAALGRLDPSGPSSNEFQQFVRSQRERDARYLRRIGERRITGSHDDEVSPRELAMKPSSGRRAMTTVARNKEQDRRNRSCPFSLRLQGFVRSVGVGGVVCRPQEVTERIRKTPGLGDDYHPANLHEAVRRRRSSSGCGLPCFTQRRGMPRSRIPPGFYKRRSVDRS